MIWIILLSLLTLLLLADTLRMRGRLSALAVLRDSDAPVSPEHRFIVAPGVTLDDATKRAASAWARESGLDLVDVVPVDLPAVRAMSLVQIVDPLRYRRDRLAAGRTAGHAMLVSTDVIARAKLTEPTDIVDFVRAAARLKHYASATSDLAVAPAERAAPTDFARRLEVLRVVLGPTTGLALLIQPVFWILIGLGVWLSPIAGLVALGAWHVQPLLAIAGTRVRSRDLLVATLFRAPLEIATLALTVIKRASPSADPALARRPEYDELLAGGVDRFFEPRREDCPVCASRELAVHLRGRDLLQHKPGRFILEKCRGCGHIFQNPRLSIDGLNFYYKDFYDGLGEAGMEMIFGFGAEPYHQRAKMVCDVVNGQGAPAKWLDVGAGHGHFCAAARDELPDTAFDGLDLSESIDEAQRRGWIGTGYRGLFPDLAPKFAGGYDVVSMSHYLEHTREPADEIAAAHTALAPKGHLMIEVPDPDFVLGKLLGKYWLPWFQPQHQHLLSASNLDKMLRAHGFTPIAWHRGPAHQRVDFFFAWWLALDGLAPPPHLPWRWRGAGATAWRGIVWTLGAPLLLLGVLADRIAEPMFRRGKVSNTYRVVARRD
jgi:SAM-dependent methyltransferase